MKIPKNMVGLPESVIRRLNADESGYKEISRREEFTKWYGLKRCPQCDGMKNQPRILGGIGLYAGDYCPHEFHGPMPGYNCF